jgi:uncharacterized membrane protein
MIEFGYQPDWTWLAGGGLAGAALILWSYHAAINKPRGLAKFLLPILRLLTIAAIVLCLLEPQWVTRIEHQQPARVAVLLDSSRSMGIQDVARNRLEAAKTWLRTGFLGAKPANVSATYYAFARNLTLLDTNTPPQDDAFMTTTATGQPTALADALENLWLSGDTAKLIGVILCSDGIENTGGDPVAIARLYRRKGVPIHTVTFGTTNEMQDIILEDVQVKRAVPNQSPTMVVVKLRGVGMTDRLVPLELRHKNYLLLRTAVRLTGASQRVELNFTPFNRGFQVYEAAIPVQAGEWLTHNNRRSFGLEVVDSTIRVIYMEGSPLQARQAEWKYLKDALQSDPNIKVKVLYRPPPTSAQGVQTVDMDYQTGEPVYHVQHPTEGYPRTLANLLQYDVVINSDINKEAFTKTQLEDTAKLVEEFGGGFVMVGGRTSFGSGGYHLTVMDRFIPVAMENDRDLKYQAFKMVVPTEALTHPLVAIGGALPETRAIWNEKFPSLYGYNRVGRAKPGAVVLGVDLTERSAYGPRIILAAQQVGRGRTMAFTSDTTRSWGRDFETLWGEKINPSGALTEANCDSRYYRRFWINAIRWLAAGKLGASNAPVTMELSQTVCRPGDKVEATVRVLDQTMKETGDAQVDLVLEGTATNQFFLAAYDPAARLYRAQLTPAVAGDFSVIATAKIRQTKRGEDKQLLSCEQSDLEMEKVQANPDLMARIAKAAKGFTVATSAGEDLKGLFANNPPVTVEIRKEPLWDKAKWLVIIAGLLTLEWVVRRLRGLA